MKNITNVPFDDLSDNDLLRWADWSQRCALSRSEVYARIQEGRHPAPIKLGARASAWKVGALRAWLADPAGWLAPGLTVAVMRYRGPGRKQGSRAA